MTQTVANQTFRRIFVSAGVLACLALSGCGGGGGGGGGNPPAAAVAPVSNPSLVVASTSIDFGTLLVNQQSQRSLQVTNNGNVTLNVTASVNDVGFDVTLYYP